VEVCLAERAEPLGSSSREALPDRPMIGSATAVPPLSRSATVTIRSLTVEVRHKKRAIQRWTTQQSASGCSRPGQAGADGKRHPALPIHLRLSCRTDRRVRGQIACPWPSTFAVIRPVAALRTSDRFDPLGCVDIRTPFSQASTTGPKNPGRSELGGPVKLFDLAQPLVSGVPSGENLGQQLQCYSSATSLLPDTPLSLASLNKAARE
jgi:hypothetical protein